MLTRLLANKPGLKRKLQSTDLELPWEPLWLALKKELWPKRNIYETSRNVVNQLLYVADQCKRYFSPSEIPKMIDTFIPLVTQSSMITMVPVITSFLPPSHTHLYIPMLFKIWQAFNSAVVDDRLMEMAGELSEEHVAGTSGEFGNEGGAAWKDIGIWTEEQWNVIIGKGLSSMNVPVGALKAGSSTGQHADIINKDGTKIKKTSNRVGAFAKVLVNSMRVDGDVRDPNVLLTRMQGGKLPKQNGYIAGSKALDALDRLITSTESFFHPSNTGGWTHILASFLHRLASEFIKRFNEEQLPDCRIPESHRLTLAIRRSFVTILRTPSLLAMFAKDPIATSFAQGALRALAMLEPDLIMPDLLERAYDGLEVVNETHRTTAVLSMLSGIARPLVTEKLWLGGQKHLVPLLELCLPGIDLNDPVKTVCATLFIVSAVQHIKIGDLTRQPGAPFSGDAESMDVEEPHDYLPDGTEMGDTPRLTREEERALVRDSNWVVSLFRRIFALYENLPEEGGRRNTTGGKQEESVLKSIKSMMDIVCLHLSDSLFDLVLNVVYDYATTNAKSNSVRAFGQLVACLARARPEKTLPRFLPFCISQIEEELKHGASSVRTTSAHAAIPSDTTLHWNMAILRGCLGYGGPILLKYQEEIIRVISLLVEKTKSERGYSSTGRLVHRVLNTLAPVYPVNTRFVNKEEWDDPQFDQNHYLSWGRLYEPQDVIVDWHVPSPGEIAFVLELLERVMIPALEKVQSLLDNIAKWDSIARNDFCRYLNACKAFWSAVPTFAKEQPKQVVNPCLDSETELPELLVSHLDVAAGFTLSDPSDPRYQTFVSSRKRFGEVVIYASELLRKGSNAEDHIDAVIGVTKSIDVYLLSYGMSRGDFDSLQKNYAQARDLSRTWTKQKDNSRLVYVKRAQVYHSGRLYMHALYRRRSDFDDNMIHELVELSLSPYTRVRRHAQSSLYQVVGSYIRSTRTILPILFDALKKGNDPDRMKGHSIYLIIKALPHMHSQMAKILEIATHPMTHWRYVHMAERFLYGLLRRDIPVSPELSSFFVRQSTSPQTAIRVTAQRALVKVMAYIKMRTYSRTAEELWCDSWHNPLERDVIIGDPSSFVESLQGPIVSREGVCYIDKIPTGFLTWSNSIKGYAAVETESMRLKWEAASKSSLEAIKTEVTEDNYVRTCLHFGVKNLESSHQTSIYALKIYLSALLFEDAQLEHFLSSLDPLISDSDKYKQRAGAEALVGIVRGSKHWLRSSSEKLWAWMTQRLNRILIQIKPETMQLWDAAIDEMLFGLDPRRNQLLVDWIMSLPVEFHGDSVFDMNKTLSLQVSLVESMGIRYRSFLDQYASRMLQNTNTGYAEIRQQICQGLFVVSKLMWQPNYSSTESFLLACQNESDPLRIRNVPFVSEVDLMLRNMEKWRNERLAPPRANQSEYDKTGLTLLQWIWVTAHSAEAASAFPYVLRLMPEILHMTELSDNPELQSYSTAVLYIISAVIPPVEYFEVILKNFADAIKSSKSWRIRLNALPALVVFFYRNLLSISQDGVVQVMDVLLECLADENVEVRSMASKALSGVVRCSQRQSIIPLKNRFVSFVRKTTLPPRSDPAYADSLRSLHSAILGICALIESLPYSVEPWMPSLTEVLAPHASDPAPISTTIRNCASEFKKTHQDTWHKDQQMFDEEQLQSLSTIRVRLNIQVFLLIQPLAAE
ncbi:hypothetical protein BDQ17DRAFT_1418131 [Cyathus striatus]|nr:hypothetical protein BDQ17DRAFT_1418131 [Cyathus striatus]